MLNLNLRHPIFFYLPLFLLFFHVRALLKTAGRMADTSNIHTKSLVHIGAVLDVDSPEGAVAQKCISMAISEFYALHPDHRTRLVLHTRSSKDLASTAAAVVDLLKNVKVHAILAPQISAVNRAGMMSEGNIWLMTPTSSSSLDVMDSMYVIDSIQGVWRIRSHIPKSKALKNFNIRWKRNLHLMELNVFGLWAYDLIWTLAMAVERLSVRNYLSPRIGPRLVKEVSNINFKGLSGEFQLVKGQLKSEAFEIFNVIGKEERVLGYWSPNKRISRRSLLYSRKSLKSSSTSSNKSIPVGEYLRIGIPVKIGFKKFVSFKKKPYTNDVSSDGFSIDVFRAALKALKEESEFKDISYKFFAYENEKGEMKGTYDELLCQIKKQNYDVVVGDTTIVAKRTNDVDFTLPYSESGVTMLVAVKHGKHRNMWIFLQPWSWDLWLAVIASFICMGLVIQIMENQTINTAFAGSRNRQLGMTLWWPFSALAIPQRELVVKDWSRFVLVIWIGFAVILMQIYTASLSSVLTVDQLQPTFDSVTEIITKQYKVGYQNNSFVKEFLIKQLMFNESLLVSYNTVKEYHKALTKGHQNGGVAAIFDEIPYIRVFLAKYGSNYMMTGPTYRTDGFGFAFPKNSSLVSSFSRAILKIREEGKLMDHIEKRYFGHTIASLGVGPQISPDDPRQLHASSLAGLFIIMAIATLVALFISERYIWSKPIELAKQYSTRYFSSQPSNGTISVAQSTNRVDSSVNTHEVEDVVGSSESIPVQTRENVEGDSEEANIQVHSS